MQKIQQLLLQLRMIDALDIAQSIAYAKQRIYEYRDKPGKQLAKVLSYHPVKCNPPVMLRANGEVTTKTKEKIEILNIISRIYINQRVEVLAKLLLCLGLLI